MMRLALTCVFALVLFSVGLACISIPNADLFSEPECVLVNSSTAAGLRECYAFYPSLPFNKTKIMERLQAFKNYSCLADKNTPGWSECVTREVNCSDGECAKWVYVRTSQLSDEDIEIIADFLSNGYSVIKQTDQEYAEFLKNASKVNSDLSTCDYYYAVAHRGNWTGFVFSEFSNKTKECSLMPRPYCAPVMVNIVWNDLENFSNASENHKTTSNTVFVLLIVLALLMIAVVVLLRKR